jgi:DNA ligase-1
MRALAAALDEVKATRSRTSKLAQLAGVLKTLDDDGLVAACRIITGAPLAVGDARPLGVGWALLIDAVRAATGLEEGAVFHALRAAGDLGDALAPLWPQGRPGLPLTEVLALFEGLAADEGREAKRARLTAALARTSGSEAKYLVKALLGELRIGVQRGTLDEALALAFGTPLERVRAASALTPDVGTLARLVKQDRLSEATITPGRVVAFMLATPTESVKEPIDPAQTVVEDKLDGVRAQAHVVDGQVSLFARGTGEVTASFPEVVLALTTLPGALVLDGEILAIAPDGGPRPFQALQARLGRTSPDAAARAQTPVAFVAYDLLFDGESLLGLPWSERRARLERLSVRTNPVTRLDPAAPLDAQLDVLFAAARGRGHEGLMLKRVDAPYEAGVRGSGWRKVKRALATLDVVITRAEHGHGKRAGVLSDYTFAVWSGPALVEIGKAYSGLTDAEIAAMTVRLQGLATGTDGRFLRVRPEVVLEVAFDGLQPSKRHDSGFALRFPRIVRIRDDKAAADADRLETVRALFDAQVRSGHREHADSPSPTETTAAQLGLFEPP